MRIFMVASHVTMAIIDNYIFKIILPFCPKFAMVCFQYCIVLIKSHFGMCS